MNKKVCLALFGVLCLLTVLSACSTTVPEPTFESPEALLAARVGMEDQALPLINETWINDRYLVMTCLNMDYTFYMMPDGWENMPPEEADSAFITEQGTICQVIVAEKLAEDRYTPIRSLSTSFSQDQDGTQATGVLCFGTHDVGKEKHDINILILDTNFDPTLVDIYDLDKLTEVQPGVYFAIEIDTPFGMMQSNYYYTVTLV